VQTKKDVQRVLKGVDRLLARVEEFARRERLNVYKKARFGNRIQWALREAQYPAEFASDDAGARHPPDPRCAQSGAG
jgi:hypothetical protein